MTHSNYGTTSNGGQSTSQDEGQTFKKPPLNRGESLIYCVHGKDITKCCKLDTNSAGELQFLYAFCLIIFKMKGNVFDMW